MEKKKISDVEAFKKESDKARNLPISKKDIQKINELSREVELEETKSIPSY